MRPGDGRATRAVIRNLWREVKTWNFAWEAHPMTSMEAFRDSASKWLGDKTELSDASIRCADWQEVYEHFLPELEMKRRDDQKER